MSSRLVLKRRTLMSQLGAAAFLAVPVFRSAFSEAQTSSPLRLLIITFPGGLPFIKAEDRPDLSFTGALAPLAPLESDIIRIVETFRPSATGEGHSAGMRTLLTGGRGAPDSIDQIVARQVGAKTRFSSLQIGVFTDEGEGMEGLFQGLIARRIVYDNGLPLTPDQDPAALFMRLFGSSAPPTGSTTDGAGMPDPKLLAAYERGKSLIDYLKAQVEAVKTISGSAEQAKLDQHLTALREMEKGLVLPGGTGNSGLPVSPGAGCQAPSLGGERTMPKVGGDMNQLAYQAINCDLTRVMTFQWMSSGDQIQRFPWIDLKYHPNYHHHALEHSSMNADGEDFGADIDFATCQRWFLEQIGSLLMALKSTSDGAGNLLDNCAVMISTDMTTGDHGMEPFVALMAGKAGGAFRTGRDFSGGGKAHNNLLLTLAQTMGVGLTDIGDAGMSTGAFDLS